MSNGEIRRDATSPDDNSEISAVVLDYGNVISRPQDPEALDRMSRIVGVKVEVLADAMWYFREPYDAGVISDEQYWREITNRVSGARLDSLAIWELTALDAFSWSIEDPAMISWMVGIRRTGIPVAVLSNMPETLAQYVLHNKSWSQLVGKIVVSAEVKCTKPHPDIFRKIVDSLEMRAENILFVDDRENNVAGAKDFGMQVLQFTDINSFRKKLQTSFPLLPVDGLDSGELPTR